jgi:hypothetical protein
MPVLLSNDLHHNLERLADSLGGTRMFVFCIHACARTPDPESDASPVGRP